MNRIIELSIEELRNSSNQLISLYDEDLVKNGMKLLPEGELIITSYEELSDEVIEEYNLTRIREKTYSYFL